MIFRYLLHRIAAPQTRGRAAHTHVLTANLNYITNGHINISAEKETMKLSKDIDRPVCVLLSWLAASHRNVMKYANLYLDQGFDVLRVDSASQHVWTPDRGSQVIARDLLKVMAANKATYVLHGLSIGSYIWSEALVQAMNDEKLYRPVLEQVVAQVWDSVGDLTRTPTGYSYQYFAKNIPARTVLGWIIEFYLEACHDSVTVHYKRAHQAFLNTACRAPALFLLSKSDPIACPKFIRNVHDTWQKNGIQCSWQCWEKSDHVQHLIEHPEEYLALLWTHLRENVPELGKMNTSREQDEYPCSAPRRMP